MKSVKFNLWSLFFGAVCWQLAAQDAGPPPLLQAERELSRVGHSLVIGKVLLAPLEFKSGGPSLAWRPAPAPPVLPPLNRDLDHLKGPGAGLGAAGASLVEPARLGPSTTLMQGPDLITSPAPIVPPVQTVPAAPLVAEPPRWPGPAPVTQLIPADFGNQLAGDLNRQAIQQVGETTLGLLIQNTGELGANLVTAYEAGRFAWDLHRISQVGLGRASPESIRWIVPHLVEPWQQLAGPANRPSQSEQISQHLFFSDGAWNTKVDSFSTINTTYSSSAPGLIGNWGFDPTTDRFSKQTTTQSYRVDTFQAPNFEWINSTPSTPTDFNSPIFTAPDLMRSAPTQPVINNSWMRNTSVPSFTAPPAFNSFDFRGFR